MATFRDKTGRDWTIELDAPTIRRVRTECDLDLVDIDGKAYERMYDDPLLLCDCLWSVVRLQAEKASVTGEQFFEAVKGDEFEPALIAIQKAVTDFTHPHRRKLLETVTAKNARIRELGMSRAVAKLEDPELEKRALAEMERRMDEELEKALTRSLNATSSPGSSESHPTA